MRVAVGDLEVFVLRTGRFRLDGGAMFGVVPRPLWERLAPPDERNRIRLGLNCLLVRDRARERDVVVDTGIGSKWDAKSREMYAIEDDPGIARAVAACGVAAERVKCVFNTHLHFDHAGGNTVRVEEQGGRDGGKGTGDGSKGDGGKGDGGRGTGEGGPAGLRLTFPNAEYVVQRGNFFEEARVAHELRRASYLPENFEPVYEAGRFRFLEGDGEAWPGVRGVVTGGHQRWHMAALVESGGEKLLFPADIVPTAAHVTPTWIMAYDHFPLETLEAKKRLLAQAVAGRWLLVLEHEPDAPLGRVARDGAKFRWEPVAA